LLTNPDQRLTFASEINMRFALFFILAVAALVKNSPHLLN